MIHVLKNTDVSICIEQDKVWPLLEPRVEELQGISIDFVALGSWCQSGGGENLEANCSGTLNKREWSKYFVFMYDLPRTLAEKLQKNDLGTYPSENISVVNDIIRRGQFDELLCKANAIYA